MAAPTAETSLPLPLFRRGKVRDVYEVDAERLLVVATDRVSAFDVVMREAVPHKGAVLTQLTAWWLGQLEGVVPHHMISASADEIVDALPALAPHRAELAQRAMLCHRADVYPVECVVRGYLSGSALKEYRASGTLAGEALPEGLVESSRLDPALFSPATKAESGHDENITVAQMRGVVGDDTAAELEALSRRAGRTILVDEVLTPDSSRFWPAEEYRPGRSQPSFDKQPLRDFLEGERRAGRWNGEAPPPPLPAEVVAATTARYLDAFRRITGHPLEPQS